MPAEGSENHPGNSGDRSYHWTGKVHEAATYATARFRGRRLNSQETRFPQAIPLTDLILHGASSLWKDFRNEDNPVY